MINDAIRQHFSRQPDELVDLVKNLRAFAASPTASPKARREAQQALERYGYDDASLQREHADSD